MKNKILNCALGGVLLLILITLTGNAQAAGQSGLTDCFQYYKFGSVKIDLQPEGHTYSPEKYITFKGKLENLNDYPIVDGELYVKLFRANPQGAEAATGDLEIAEFSAVKNILLSARGTQEVIFSYQLPSGLANGRYVAHFSFNVAEKYNLAGLSFHDALPGGIAAFDIAGPNDKAIYFEKSQAKINGTPYGFRRINNPLEKGTAINVTIPLQNPTGLPVEVKVNKELFFWDALSENNKIASREETVSVPAGGSKTVAYEIPLPEYSTYLVRLTAKSENGQSVVGIRPTVKDIFQPRLNFPALASFPLKKGQKSVLFACFHNAGTNRNNGKIAITLKDENSEIISQHVYGGTVPSEMAGIAKEFTPTKNYGKVTIESELYNDQGKLIDSSVQNYDCGEFNPGICDTASPEPASPIAVPLPEQESYSTNMPGSPGMPLWQKVLLGIWVLVLLLAGLLWWKIRIKLKNNQAKN